LNLSDEKYLTQSACNLITIYKYCHTNTSKHYLHKPWIHIHSYSLWEAI